MFENIFYVVQTTDQRNWLSSDYVIWIPPMDYRLYNPNLFDNGEKWRKLHTLCRVRDSSDYIIRNKIFFSYGPHCTNSFCGPGCPDTSINRCPCFHNQKP